MASLQTSRLALLRKACQVEEKRKIQTPQKQVDMLVVAPPKRRRIAYQPLAKEVTQRQSDLTSSTFKLVAAYTEYGSSNDGWRSIPCTGKKFALPKDCPVRMSLRIKNRSG